MKKRIGKFYVSRDAIDGADIPAILSWIEFTPYRVELLAHRDQFEFIGTSGYFDEQSLTKDVPTYDLVVTAKEHPETKEMFITKIVASKC